MTTVAERLRKQSIDRARRMSAGDRVAETLELGQAAVRAYAAAHALDLPEARLRLERSGQAGRRPSRVMREILE